MIPSSQLSDSAKAVPTVIRPGLVEFYSSQATLMLAQYQNIGHLLGQTSDYTGPGTHCEILLRDFLRRYLPSNFRADKGFIYGRRASETASCHCPEIDILIHDNHNFRPILQIEDFVITQAKATYGAIQVKRRMDTTKLKEGLANVAEAKAHFLKCHLSTRNSLSFFSAVVFFDEESARKDGRPSETYENRIRDRFTDPEEWELAPDIVGSLQGHIFYRLKYGDDKLQYVWCPATCDGQNVAVQVLLWKMSQKLSQADCHLPFDFPDGLRGGQFEIVRTS
jgi:hypothetical protein